VNVYASAKENPTIFQALVTALCYHSASSKTLELVTLETA